MRSNAAGTLCALVAIKSRAHCKTRLAGALPAQARLALVDSMLTHVLAAVSRAHCVQRAYVVSPERGALPAATALIADHGASLNAALAHAHAQLAAMGHAEMLVLPADLPYVTGLEIEAFVEAGRQDGFAIAPDLAGRGTNALYLRTDTAFRFEFGADSFARHLQQAAALGLTARVVRLPGLAFDVDEPADLQALSARQTALREGTSWTQPARL